MKKVLLAAALAAAPFTTAMADDDIGCGLGSMVWAGQSGIVPHLLAGTTNGTSGNQTFGITFGTLGCDGSSEITSKQRLAMFTGDNIDQLMSDAARGTGETLEVFSELYGVEVEQRAAFAASIQENFAAIFPNGDVTAQQVLSAIDALQS